MGEALTPAAMCNVRRYFRLTRLALPVRTNAIAHLLLNGTLTRGGDVPQIVHYTVHKPFHPELDLPGYQYLCRRPHTPR